MRSSAARSRACGFTPSSRARSPSSFTRGLWLPLSMSSSTRLPPSWVSAASTAWMPISSSVLMLPGFGVGDWGNGTRPGGRSSVPIDGSSDEPRSGRQRGDQAEVDLAVLEARAQHLHAHRVAEAELQATAFAAQQAARRVEMVVVVRQLGDVHEAVDLRFRQFHEQPEGGHPGNDAVELAADVLLHPGALVAFVDVAFGLVGAALVVRAMHAQAGHAARAVLVRDRLAAFQRVT